MKNFSFKLGKIIASFWVAILLFAVLAGVVAAVILHQRKTPPTPVAAAKPTAAVTTADLPKEEPKAPEAEKSTAASTAPSTSSSNKGALSGTKTEFTPSAAKPVTIGSLQKKEPLVSTEKPTAPPISPKPTTPDSPLKPKPDSPLKPTPSPDIGKPTPPDTPLEPTPTPGTDDKPIDPGTASLPDGSYTGKAMGYGGNITVKVTVAKGKIAKVIVDSHTETKEYYDKAAVLLQKIVEKNSTAIDVVSGATVSSKAILSAVDNALAGLSDKPQTQVLADGTWYGQGRGRYDYDRYNATHGNVGQFEAAIVVKDGVIIDTKLESFGDDEGYTRPEGYRLIGEYIKKNNGISELPAILSSRTGEIPDAVSGATQSARGYVNALDNAISRAAKFQKDNINQEIRSIAFLDPPFHTVNYGQEVDLSAFNILVTYTDGKTETVPFAQLSEKGIQCNYPQKFVVTPDDPERYDEYKDFWLTLTHEKSTSRHAMPIQAKREIVYSDPKELIIETEDAVYPISIKDDFRYTVALEQGKSQKITKARATASDGANIEIQDIEAAANQKATYRINLKPLEAAQPKDPVVKVNRYDTFIITLDSPSTFDPETISAFEIKTLPKKMTYFVGETLDLSGLTLIAKDASSTEQIVTSDEMATYGFSAIPVENTALDATGEMTIAIAHKNAAIPQQTFKIAVNEKTTNPHKVVFYDGETILQTVILTPGETTYPVAVPKKYENQTLSVKVFDEKDGALEPLQIKNLGTLAMKIKFNENDYAVFSFNYVAD